MEIDIVEYLNSRRFTILWSGGKDSTAALLWVLNHVHHEDWDILFIEVTGNTHRLNIQYVYDIAKQLGVEKKLIHVKREDIDFFSCMRKWGVPIFGKYRWCLHQFKQRIIEKYANLVQVTGIRKTDSKRRRSTTLFMIFRQTGNKIAKHSIVINPLSGWNKKQVIDYIRSHGLQLNPCYNKFGHSGNCMFCPYHSVSNIIRTLNDPEWGPKILAAIRDVAKKIRKGGHKEKIVRNWLRHANRTLTSFF